MKSTPMMGRPPIDLEVGTVSHTDHDVTQLLNEWSQGNQQALGELLPIVYDELRKLAHIYLRRERSEQTLQTTALVHEAFLKLVDQKSVTWQNRSHFFGIAAQAMRRILIDNARRRTAAKRAPGEEIPFDEARLRACAKDQRLIALDEALKELETIDPQQSRVVELRYFGGMTIEETAEALHLSPATVKREWSMARAWLYRNLKTVS
jgi:RNA polymerase sigma factor (TIGR02999 family)